MTAGIFFALLSALALGLAGLVWYSFRLVRGLRRSFREITSSGADPAMQSVLARHKGPLGILVLLAVAESALGLASPWPLQVVVDNAIGRRSLPPFLSFMHGLGHPATAAVAAAFGVVLVGALAVVGYAVTSVSTVVGESVGVRLRAGLVHRLLHAPLSYLDDKHSGDFVSRVTTDVGRVQDSLLARIEVLLPQGIAIAGMTVLMALLSPLLALVVLAVAPALVATAMIRRRVVTEAQRRSRARAADVNAQASELIRNVRLVRSFGQQQRAVAKFDRTSRDAAASTVDATVSSARLSPLADVILALDLAAVLVLGTAQVASHRLSLGELLVFLAYLSSLQGPVRSLSQLASTLGKGTASAERIDEVLGSAGPASGRAAIGIATETPDVAKPATSRVERGGGPSIVFDRVSFGYGGRPAVLKDLTLEIEPETTAVVFGPSGAGKSTLLSLVVRLHDPDDGTVRIAERDIRSLDLTTLHRSVALVPQDAWLVGGTIQENIAFGVPDASEDEIKWASRLAHVDEFVDRLPLAWHTDVGEGGVRLSGGQRRRIALARALLARTPVLLLDEPTAGLDALSKRFVIDTIATAAERRTVVIATHDEDLAALADSVLVVDGGSVRAAQPEDGLARIPSNRRGISPQNLQAASTAGPSGGRFIVEVANATERR